MSNTRTVSFINLSCTNFQAQNLDISDLETNILNCCFLANINVLNCNQATIQNLSYINTTISEIPILSTPNMNCSSGNFSIVRADAMFTDYFKVNNPFCKCIHVNEGIFVGGKSYFNDEIISGNLNVSIRSVINELEVSKNAYLNYLSASYVYMKTFEVSDVSFSNLNVSSLTCYDSFQACNVNFSVLNACNLYSNNISIMNSSISNLLVNNASFQNFFANNILTDQQISASSGYFDLLKVKTLKTLTTANFSFGINSTIISASYIRCFRLNELDPNSLAYIANVTSDVQSQIDAINNRERVVDVSFSKITASFVYVPSLINSSMSVSFVNVSFLNNTIQLNSAQITCNSLNSRNSITSPFLSVSNMTCDDAKCTTVYGESASFRNFSGNGISTVVSNTQMNFCRRVVASECDINNITANTISANIINGVNLEQFNYLTNIHTDIQFVLDSIIQSLSEFYPKTGSAYFNSVNSSNASINSLSVANLSCTSSANFIFPIVQGFSDNRLKIITNQLTPCLQSINKLHAFKYLPNHEVFSLLNVSLTDNDNCEQFGLSAQEVAEYFPEVVYTAPLQKSIDFYNHGKHVLNNSETPFLTIRYERLVPVLIKCIQELYDLIQQK